NNVYDIFREITDEGFSFLVSFDSVAGNLSGLFNNFDFDTFISKDVLSVVFTDDTVENKLNDIEININKVVNKLRIAINNRIS
ncbi:MAG: hypothetical protein ACTSUT_15285, partial [Promethearchaeota archaeon]